MHFNAMHSIDKVRLKRLKKIESDQTHNLVNIWLHASFLTSLVSRWVIIKCK